MELVRLPNEKGGLDASVDTRLELKDEVSLLVREKGDPEAVVMATLGTETEEA